MNKTDVILSSELLEDTMAFLTFPLVYQALSILEAYHLLSGIVTLFVFAV